MSQPSQPYQPDLKIINFKPGPRTQRLSKSELIVIEPLVRNLHEQGQSREAMRAQCSTLIQKPITLSQLDTIRQRLDLAVYDKSKAFSTRKIESDESETVPGFEHDSQDAKASRDDSRTRENQQDSAMGTEEDTSSIRRQSVSHDSFLRAQHEIETNEDTLMPNAEQHPVCGETLDYPLDISSSSPALDQIHAEVERPFRLRLACPPRPLALDKLKYATPGALQNYLESLKLVYSTDSSSKPAEFFIKCSLSEMTELASAVISLEDLVEPCKSSTLSPELYHKSLQQNEDEEDALIRLNHAAALLHTMKAPTVAFNVFFSIYTHFVKLSNQKSKSAGLVHRILSTIGCVRSARNAIYYDLSMAMLIDVCEELFANYDIRYLETTRLWKLLGTLKAYVKWPWLLESFQSEGFMTPYTMLPVYSWEEKNISFERLESLLGILEGERDISLMQNLQSRPGMKLYILCALEATALYVKRRPDFVNRLLRDLWDHLGPPAAQLLCYCLLEDSAFQATFQHKSNKADPSSKWVEFPFILEEQALAFVPFLLIERIFHDEFSGERGAVTGSAQRSSPSSSLLRTIDKVAETLESNVGYASVINSYISHISSGGLTPSRMICRFGQVIPNDQLMEIAGITAHAMSPTHHCGWLRTEDQSRPGLPRSAREVDTASMCATIAQSYTSSNSSSFRSFKSVGNRARRLAASIGIRS